MAICYRLVELKIVLRTKKKTTTKTPQNIFSSCRRPKETARDSISFRLYRTETTFYFWALFCFWSSDVTKSSVAYFYFLNFDNVTDVPKSSLFHFQYPPPTSVFFYDSTKWFQRMFFLRCISLLIISTRSSIFLRDICRSFRPNTRGRAVVCVCTNKPSLSICPILYTIHPILFICVVNVLYLKDEMPRVPRLKWTMFMCAIAVYFIRCVLMLCACHFVVFFFLMRFLFSRFDDIAAYKTCILLEI